MSSSNGECSSSSSSSTKTNSSGSGIPPKGPKRTTVQHQQVPPRPKLVPTYPSAQVPTKPSYFLQTGSQADLDDDSYLPYELSSLPTPPRCGETEQEQIQWTSIITAPAFAPMQSWLNVMQSLIRHPERNSTNILRADIVSETDSSAEMGSDGVSGRGWEKQWTIRRSLLPRRPNLDWGMLQDCSLFYRYRATEKLEDSQHGDVEDEEEREKEVEEAVVVYTPLVGDVSHPKMDLPDSSTIPASDMSSPAQLIGRPPPNESYIPFYHPKVRALAFHFDSTSACPSDTDGEATFGQVGISLIPFCASPTSYPPTHRLSRVGLSLLTTLHMHTWGDLHSYRKRVHHDTIIPRSLYQDLYLSLKTRYASSLIAGWREATDPSKHVFEEMGIAAFLIGLWTLQHASDARGDEGWKRQVKFVDVGCGNGLLTYILTREGFTGIGVDMRARKSWPAYSSHADLREWSFHPSCLLASPTSCSASDWTGAWLIGNHADQLTPWLPYLATHFGSSGFINLPCCYYALDGSRDFPLLLKPAKGEAQVSRNEQYLAYVSQLHAHAGWKLELDPLRIPSTKNWCFVGRRRQDVPEGGEEQERVLEHRVRHAVEQASLGVWGASDLTSG